MKDKTEKKKQDKVVILSAILIISTILVGSILIYKPYIDKNKSLREKILYERDRNILIGRIKALGKHLKIYEKRMPEGKGVSWLISEVSDMAAKERIEISSVKPGSPEDRYLYTKLYIILDAVSDYAQLGRFISRIESAAKFLTIESINIKRLDFDKDFDKGTSKFKSFDVKSRVVISTIVYKE